MKFTVDGDDIVLENGDVLHSREICDAIGVDKSDVVYMSGSIIESILSPIGTGMGNQYSDLDIYIIREHSRFVLTETAYHESIKKSQFFDEFPIGLDIEIYDKEYVRDLTKNISSLTINQNEKIFDSFLRKLPNGGSIDAINTFLCRLKYSICIHNDKEYSRIKEKILFSSFLDLMISCITIGSDNLMADAAGNLEKGNIDVALYCTRQIMLNIMWAEMMGKGFFADREKWIFLKFKNMCNTNSPELRGLFEVAMHLFRGNLTDDNECRVTIEKTLATAKKSMEDIALGGLKI